MKTVLILSGLLLVGCGGGGGSTGTTSSASTLAYEGKTEKAVLTEENTKYFLDLLSNFSQSVDTPSYFKSQKITVANKSTQKLGKSIAQNNKVLGKETIDGDISGSCTVVREETGTYTRKLTSTCNNYSDIKGEVYNGTVVNYLTANDQEIITKSVNEYQLFNVKINGEDITLDGSITTTKEQTGTKLVENYVVKNNKTAEMLKYDKYQTLLNTQGQAVSFSGKVYDSNYGYVDVSTLTPLAYNANGSRKAEGEVLFEGESSSTTVKYAYDNRVRVEIDTDKDGTVDTVQVYREGEYETQLPNAAPVITITFPKSIYTDTDMSQVKVDVYDPDLDGFTSSYEWEINGTNQGSELALDNTLFKKHDMLKLTVNATDDRVGDEQSSTVFKEQEVLNSAPVIILDLNTTYIRVGQSISVDASQSYDADGDSLTFGWSTQDRVFGIYDEGYNLGSKYLELDDSNLSKVIFLGEKINYDYITNEPSAYGIKVTVDDGDSNGKVDKNSNDIIVDVMDLFKKEIVNLQDYNISTDAITAATIEDINRDGLKDIIIATDTYGDYADNAQIIIFLQDSTHKFIVSKKIDLEDIAPYSYNSISAGDLNNDGFIDIAYTSPTMKGFNVYYQDADGNFIEEKTYNTKTFAYIPFPPEPENVEYLSDSVDYLNVKDFNQDGKSDVVTIGSNAMAGSSTGIDIFLQNDTNLSATQMLALDNRTIEGDGNYEVTDSHKIAPIIIEDVDNDNLNDLIVGNYIEYQEVNGTYSEKIYENMDTLVLHKLNDSNHFQMAGLNSFEKKLFIYENNASARDFVLKDTVNVLMENPNQLFFNDMNNDGQSDLILGHESWPYFTIFIRKDSAYYSDQLFKIDNNLAYSSMAKSIFIEDINNDKKEDIVIFGSQGFELFYNKK